MKNFIQLCTVTAVVQETVLYITRVTSIHTRTLKP